MRAKIKKGLSGLLMAALLLSLLPRLSAAAWADGIEALELELVEITEQEQETPPAAESEDEPEALPEEPPEMPPEKPAAEIPEETPPAPETGESETTAPEETEPDLFLENSDTFESPSAQDVQLYAKVSVDENFVLSLYISLPDGADPAQYHVRTVFTAQLSECVNDRDLSAEDFADGLYAVPEIAAARAYQLTAPIDITLSSGETTLSHAVYSVRDYLTALMAKKEYASFCHAALCYGGACQRWLQGDFFPVIDEETGAESEEEFEVFPDDFADEGLEKKTDTGRPVRETGYYGTIPGLRTVAASYEIGNKTALRFYFQGASAAAELADNDERYTVTAPVALEDGVWYVDMTGIRAAELANDFVLNATLQGQTVQVLYSPYCYAARNWNSDNVALAEFCRALVAWGNEAKAMAAVVKEGET